MFQRKLEQPFWAMYEVRIPLSRESESRKTQKK
jgi:hypothetical protein